MTFDEFQAAAASTAIYPGRHTFPGLSYAALGLSGEAGEIANKVKKIQRDNGGFFTRTECVEIAKEVSDVLWYVAAVADEIGISLDEIARMNIAKLKSRKDRGVLQGSGDNR